MKARTEKAVKEALADMLDVLSYKVRHGSMNVSDARAILDIILQGGGVRATAKELAGYYGQSEDNVRHVIHRNLLPAPERRVYYDFGAFRDAVPEKWRSLHSLPAD
jgi:hypothetical protein